MVLTNAAGGINLSYEKGQLILIDDHINLLPDNPLIGRNIDKLGVRFPDMSAPYSNSGNELLMAVAEAFDYNLQNGVYAAVIGPNLETRAEYRFLKTIGADLVGMSTVPEVIAANHMNLPCVAISIVTDLCDPDNLEEANIGDIIANAGIGEKILIKLIPSFLQKLKVLNLLIFLFSLCCTNKFALNYFLNRNRMIPSIAFNPTLMKAILPISSSTLSST